MANSRREFIKKTGLAGLAMSTNHVQQSFGDMVSGKSSGDPIVFLSPIDGDMLNEYDGKIAEGTLVTKVKIAASPDRNIRINGVVAKVKDGICQANIALKDYKNEIEAVDSASGEKQTITVFWLKNYINKFRLSIDDNIWFLKDLHVNSGKYKSIFKNSYLHFLRQVHETYGTKIHLNIFYQTDGFNLSQMTDKYKSEWKDNADWLRLSFHALGEFPDRPYLYSGHDEVKKDCEMVKEQIRRFAGEELMGHVTTLHWGTATVEGCRALKEEGYNVLAGYFSKEGPDTVSYYVNDEKRLHVNNRFIWRDNAEGLIFDRIALVLNTVKLEQIKPYLEGLRSDSHKPPYIDLMIHEQYFYDYYKNYQPDFKDKVLTGVKWAVDNGYKPAFLGDCVFG